MTVDAAVEPAGRSDEASAKRGERRTLGVASGAHVLHDGYTDLVWVALPIWQAEFGLSYAVVGLLRTIYSGALASLQIPAAAVAARLGAGAVLAAGTALAAVSARDSRCWSWRCFWAGLARPRSTRSVRRW